MNTNSFKINIRLILSGVLIITFLSPLAFAAGTSPEKTSPKKNVQDTATKSQELYQKGMAAAEAENYDNAYDYFKRAHREDAGNPDILNMLAFSQRKRGNLDEAFEYYDKALKLRPRFPEAREYLGEAHIQAALEQIRILQTYGSDADHALEELVEAFRKAAKTLP